MIYIFSDIDDCDSYPCENNATCVDEVNDYTCNCTVGYFGKNCSQSMILHILYPSLFLLRYFGCILVNGLTLHPYLVGKFEMFDFDLHFFQMSTTVNLNLAKTVQLVLLK